jgi:hypothetical protein
VCFVCRRKTGETRWNQVQPVSSVDKNMLIPVDKDFENLNVRYMITTASRQDRENFLFNDTFFLSKKGELMFKHFMYKMLLNKKT